jgi:hypothetical protein
LAFDEGVCMTIDELIAAIAAEAEQALPPAAARLFGPDKVSPASPDDVAAFEAEIGTTLPDDYRQFLLRSNGGSLGDKYELEGTYAVIASVGGFREGYSLRSARACYQASPVRIPRALLWIMDDPGGNAICLGLTGEYRGKVYFWDHDEEPHPDEWDGEVETAGNIQWLANSFTDFVARLRRWK